MLSNGKVAKMPNKLTDSEIVKALECCARPLPHCYCNECPASKYGGCAMKTENVIDLINRLQAENERLNALIAETNEQRGAVIHAITHIDQVKTEAYKEFADRLKNEIINDTAYACDSSQHSGYYDYKIKIGDIPEYIDNLLKELVGDT